MYPHVITFELHESGVFVDPQGLAWPQEAFFWLVLAILTLARVVGYLNGQLSTSASDLDRRSTQKSDYYHVVEQIRAILRARECEVQPDHPLLPFPLLPRFPSS